MSGDQAEEGVPDVADISLSLRGIRLVDEVWPSKSGVVTGIADVDCDRSWVLITLFRKRIACALPNKPGSADGPISPATAPPKLNARR